MLAYTYRGYIKDDFTFKCFHSYFENISKLCEITSTNIGYESYKFDTKSVYDTPSYSPGSDAVKQHANKEYSFIIDKVLKIDERLKDVFSASFFANRNSPKFFIHLEWCNHLNNAAAHNKEYDIITFYILDKYKIAHYIDDALLILETLCATAMDLIEFRKLESLSMNDLVSYVSHDNPLQQVNFSRIELLEKRKWNNVKVDIT